jgi:hypothetical protein
MGRLRYLNLYNNTISGQLPDNWAQLAALQQLNIAENQITGIVPLSFASLSALYLMNLANNTALCGDLPVGLQHSLDPDGASYLDTSCTWLMEGMRTDGSACRTALRWKVACVCAANMGCNIDPRHWPHTTNQTAAAFNLDTRKQAQLTS